MADQDGVRLESRSGIGTVLVATKAFKAGELIVYEEALLHVPQLKPSNPLYRPLQAYFEQHSIPASVILKFMAYFTASPEVQAKVLASNSPDPAVFVDRAEVKQAQHFADVLLQNPPVPEFTQWMAEYDQRHQQGTEQQQRQQRPPSSHDLLVKLWLLWSTFGQSYRMGSAIFHYGSKLLHTCAAPNTEYRTAAGEIQSVHGMAAADGGGSSSVMPGQRPPPAVAAAGYHVAIADIKPGDILTTNYLGLGYKRLMSTPARQQLLQRQFMYNCGCNRCTRERDLARGIPCPACSGPFRAADKLLQEQVALPQQDLLLLQLPDSERDSTAAAAAVDFVPTPTAAQHLSTISEGNENSSSCNGSEEDGSTAAAIISADGAGGAAPTGSGSGSAIGSSSGSGPGCNSSSGSGSGSGSGSSSECGYIYCDMAQLSAGAAEPWKCDVCGAMFANNTADLWGRYYTRSHATIEGDMESWIMRLDESIDNTPFVRVPSSLHDRVVGIVRLLGPRHWASWRLLLLGVELHCGILEQAAMQYKISPTSGLATAAAATPEQQQQQRQESLQFTATQAAGWVLSYCKQLWHHINHIYGEIEAGQVLGYHFTEAAHILLQVSSTAGLLQPAAAAAETVMDAALKMQQLVLPGMRSVMGEHCSPLAQVIAPVPQQQQQHAPPAAAADRPGRYIAASVQRYLQQQSAEAVRVQAAVAELRQMEVQDQQQYDGDVGQHASNEQQ